MTLEVAEETSVAAGPGECALDDPALGQNRESLDIVVASDYLERAPKGLAGPFYEFARVGCVSPDELEAGECLAEGLENELGAVAVLDGRFVDDDGQNQAEGIDDDVAFATVDFLARIIATRPPFSVVFTD